MCIFANILFIWINMASQIKIMGIVNVNDDSFFAGSRVSGAEQFMAR